MPEKNRRQGVLRHWMQRLRIDRLCKDRAGGVLVMVAFLTPVVFGVSALGMDATSWYMERRTMQTVSDVAAIAGTHVAATNATAAEIENAVMDEVTRNGFTVNPSDTITVNSPPSSGSHAGESGYVEVIVERDAKLLLASVVTDNAARIRVRSVGGSVVNGEHCVLSLDKSANRALEFTGSANVTLDCGIAANSNASDSISIDGSAQLTADPAQTFGDIYVSNNATLNTNHPVRTYAQRTKDPYGSNGRDLQALIDTALAANPSCDHGSAGSSTPTEFTHSPQTLTPGRYCGGIVGKHETHHLDPGVYIIDGGILEVEAGGGFEGTDVTFILTGPAPMDVARVELDGGGSFELKAPSSGDWRGVLMAQDDLADPSLAASFFKGNSSTDLAGVLYFPDQDFVFEGGSSSTNKCVQLVARKVRFSGGGALDTDSAICAALGIDKITQVRVKLVE